MKQIKEYSLSEVEELLNTNLLQGILALIAEKRFGIPNSYSKTKKELRELINASVEHEKTMKTIKEAAYR